MRWIAGICLSLMVAGLVAQEPIELITYNIRLNTPADGEHAWPIRRADVVNLLKFHRAEIFCVQEALPEQIDDLAASFPEYSYEGVGRDDGKRAGEFSAIFYNSDRFKKRDGGTFWLSETPGECSFGWDAACRRVCSWVELVDQKSGTSFHVFNTHFDHVGMEARKNSAALILKRISEITGAGSSAGKGAVVLCGDFNLSPDSEPIRMISATLLDAFRVSELPPHSSTATFHGFTYDDPPGVRIDYVFVSDNFRVIRYGALTDSRNRSFFSDHLPVLVTLLSNK
jgi:endonuclease/exonuclease/phosphatase family metal-dependent hydrolase